MAPRSLAMPSNRNPALHEAIGSFVGCEDLDGANDRCPHCSGVGCRYKATELSEPYPPMLVIQMKRWEAMEPGGRRRKDTRVVEFNERLPVRDGATYWLRSVIVHSGADNAGHYTAYVRTVDGEWFFYDDSDLPRFLPAGFASVAAAEAYLLFYEL